jgi:nucleoid DNA-binding protein
MPQQSKIKLLIADDHEVLRSGIKAMLVGTEIKVIAEVATGQAAVKDALNRHVNKKDIVQAIAEELGLMQLQTKPIVQKTFDAIVNTLIEEGRAELRNFGVFQVRWRKPRTARNPRTGEKVMVPERCTVTFRPGRVMKQRVEEECRTTVAAD